MKILTSVLIWALIALIGFSVANYLWGRKIAARDQTVAATQVQELTNDQSQLVLDSGVSATNNTNNKSRKLYKVSGNVSATFEK